MDPNLYAVIGLMITEGAAIAALWLRMRASERRNGHRLDEQGERLHAQNGDLQILMGRVIDMERQIREVSREKDQWQLRALQCEDRARQMRS